MTLDLAFFLCSMCSTYGAKKAKGGGTQLRPSLCDDDHLKAKGDSTQLRTSLCGDECLKAKGGGTQLRPSLCGDDTTLPCF